MYKILEMIWTGFSLLLALVTIVGGLWIASSGVFDRPSICPTHSTSTR